MAGSSAAQLWEATRALATQNPSPQDPAETQARGDLNACEASAVEHGARSAIKLLQNECAHEYLGWFPICTRNGDTTKACAVIALLTARTAIEGSEQHGSNRPPIDYSKPTGREQLALTPESTASDQLMYCVNPEAQYGTYSSFDGGKSVGKILEGKCRPQYLTFLHTCAAEDNQTQDKCILAAMVSAQLALRNFGK
jgi:hypothetical protein